METDIEDLTGDELGTLEEIQGSLSVRFDDIDILRRALTHSSAKSRENPCNERLEFLGDSVLGLVIAHELYARHPDFDEGDLTQVKSVVVSSRVLSRVGGDLGLERFISVGKGIKRRKGLPPSLVADVVEALIGALYLDRGLDEARSFVLRMLGDEIDEVLGQRGGRNFKSMFQDYTQKNFGITPVYRIVSESGPSHGKTFEVIAVVRRRMFPAGTGRNKKDAEQSAAENALSILQSETAARLPVPLWIAPSPFPWGAYSPLHLNGRCGSGEAGS